MPDTALHHHELISHPAAAGQHSGQHSGEETPFGTAVPVPEYLREVYGWAYLDPAGVRLFERPWLVNLILWGNYHRLREAALAEFELPQSGRVLQMACVYGNLTRRLIARLAKDAELDVIDVAPIQLTNLRAKLPADPRVRLRLQDTSATDFPDATFAATLIFFLLHEQPEAVRRQTLAEALRVTRPGGRIVIVDYHRPAAGNPLRALMWPVLKRLEPFALDLWRHDIADYLPAGCTLQSLAKSTCFGGLYQKLVITVGNPR